MFIICQRVGWVLKKDAGANVPIWLRSQHEAAAAALGLKPRVISPNVSYLYGVAAGAGAAGRLKELWM